MKLIMAQIILYIGRTQLFPRELIFKSTSLLIYSSDSDLSLSSLKMLEVTANKERSKKSSKPPKRTDKDEFGCISFEELLAQEKKDAFWFVAHLKCLVSKLLIFCHCL